MLTFKQYIKIEESWYSNLTNYLHRKIHPKGYDKLVKIYINKVKKYKKKANKLRIIKDIIKPYHNITARNFIKYINDLIKKGVIPKEFEA